MPRHKQDQDWLFAYSCPILKSSGLNYKRMTIINDDSSVINKLEALLTDDARGVIYDRRKFIIQATGKDFFKSPYR
jgi:hypothetical protein